MTWDLSLTWLRLRLVWNCWDSRLQHLRFDFPQMTLTWRKVVPKDLRLNLTLAISHDLRLDLRLVFQDLKHELDLSQMTCDLTWNSLKWLWLDINLSLMTWDLLERPHQLYVKIVETDLFFERFYKALDFFPQLLKNFIISYICSPRLYMQWRVKNKPWSCHVHNPKPNHKIK